MFRVTAAINLRSLGESWSHLWRSEVKWLSTVMPATRSGRLFGRPPSPWRLFTAAGEWLPTPSQAPPGDTAATYKSLPEENNGAICSALIKDDPTPRSHMLLLLLLLTTSQSHRTPRDTKLQRSCARNLIFTIRVKMYFLYIYI